MQTDLQIATFEAGRPSVKSDAFVPSTCAVRWLQMTVVVKFEYDHLNRVTEIASARHGNTAFRYDPNGNLLAVTDAKKQTTTFTYDLMRSSKTRNGDRLDF